MNFFNTISFIASAIAILSFLFRAYKKRAALIHALSDFRERHKNTIQKIDAFITPYKTRFNVLWETYTFLASIYVIFAGSVITFTAHVVEQKDLIQCVMLFTLYLGLSYSVKYMGRYIRL